MIEARTIRYIRLPVPGHRAWLDIPPREDRHASLKAASSANPDAQPSSVVEACAGGRVGP